MAFIKTKDGAKIFYKDWGKGQPILFSHGWPLNSDAWDAQMLFFGERGYRVIAHDRRSHGRSTQTWDGNNMDQYADDLAELVEKLDLKKMVIVGHSTGGGEITHYMGRHGTKRVAKAVLLGAVPPLLLKTDKNPDGIPRAVFDGIRKGVREDRADYYREFATPFFGYNRKGAKASQGVHDAFWQQAMVGGLKGQYDCIHEFSEVDFGADLKKIDVPTLIAHGDDDQIVPIAISAMKSSKIVKNATLKVYPGAPHGLATTHADEFNADMLAFLEGKEVKAAA